MWEGSNRLSEEEVEQGFVGAGWEVAGSSRYPLVGVAEGLSLTAHEQYAKIDDPVFELVDSRLVSSYWVREIPTPDQAAKLLKEHSGPPEQERGNPHKR
jgi:hypothetical protein